jgi:hypothetical protein
MHPFAALNSPHFVFPKDSRNVGVAVKNPGSFANQIWSKDLNFGKLIGVGNADASVVEDAQIQQAKNSSVIFLGSSVWTKSSVQSVTSQNLSKTVLLSTSPRERCPIACISVAS